MRTRNLMVTCGTIMSLFAAGQAMAQQEQPPKTPANPPAVQPKEVKPIEFPDAKTRTTASNAPSILRDMEGVWRVEVMCNHEHWKLNEGSRSPEDRNRVNDPNRVRDPANQDDPGRPTEPVTPPRTDPSKPSDPNADPNNPNKISDPFKKSDPNQPAATQATMQGGKNYVGYAETKLILGGNILQQKLLIPDMMTDGMGKTPGRIDGANTQPSANAGEMFRGLSYLTFDANSQQYHCAFMDSRSGQIHCDSGTYNESEKRIVFEGRKGNRSGEKSMHDDHNVRVVVDVLSPTQHRVTMYNLDGATMAPDRTTPSRTTPSTPTDPNRPATDPAQPDRTRDINAANRDGSIIYQATYTKASSDDATKYRRLIEEPGTPMTTERTRDQDRKDTSK